VESVGYVKAIRDLDVKEENVTSRERGKVRWGGAKTRGGEKISKQKEKRYPGGILRVQGTASQRADAGKGGTKITLLRPGK